jgi:hypothetical protein
MLQVFSCIGALVPLDEGKRLIFLRFAALTAQQSKLVEQRMRMRVGPTGQTDQM